jgi:ribosomal protein L37E
MLGTAETMSDHATCRQCNTYAAFNVLASGSDSELLDSETAEPSDPDSIWLKVKCRKCGNEWTL